MIAKYVMLDGTCPVIFCGSISHVSIRALAGIEDRKITSAGFLMVDEQGKVSVYGESHSLRMKPEDTDVEFLQRLLEIE